MRQKKNQNQNLQKVAPCAGKIRDSNPIALETEVEGLSCAFFSLNKAKAGVNVRVEMEDDLKRKRDKLDTHVQVRRIVFVVNIFVASSRIFTS